MNKSILFLLAFCFVTSLLACSKGKTQAPPSDPQTEEQAKDTAKEQAKDSVVQAEDPAAAKAPQGSDSAKAPEPDPTNAAPSPSAGSPVPGDTDDIIKQAQDLTKQQKWDDALTLLLDALYKDPASKPLDKAYQDILDNHPSLHAEPKQLIVDQDITHLKRIGGGSSLVYKLLKNKETVAAFKPFQERGQSNYRAEIAAYRLCPLIRCGFDIPTNIPVYFDFKSFSGLYARLASNPKEEFTEIIPTRLPDNTFRVDGTYKDWIPDFADFPIEFTNIWRPWLNSGTSRQDLEAPLSQILPEIAKRHKGGSKFADKLSPHIQNTTQYELARQISNLLVFDFLINNWDRFSGSPTLYGVNCQIAHGRFMSIDNGAGFPVTPSPKPDKHLHEITRFSRLTYNAIQALAQDKQKVNDSLFPNPSDREKERLETFWKQREIYLNYVQKCIDQNGEAETFFFE